MDQSVRDELIRQLISQQAEISAKLGQLGIKNDTPRPRKSPDGGAVSDAHQFMHATLVKTMRVRLRNVKGSDEAIIAAAHFDPAKHEKLDTERAPRKIPVDDTPEKGGRAARGNVSVSKHTRDEMLTMTVPHLRGLPEVTTGMNPDEIPDKKGPLVDAILAVREGVSAATE